MSDTDDKQPGENDATEESMSKPPRKIRLNYTPSDEMSPRVKAEKEKLLAMVADRSAARNTKKAKITEFPRKKDGE